MTIETINVTQNVTIEITEEFQDKKELTAMDIFAVPRKEFDKLKEVGTWSKNGSVETVEIGIMVFYPKHKA